MKLAPRKRKVRSDYLVDNAAALNLGKLFLRWGRKKTTTSSKKKKATSPTPKASAADESTVSPAKSTRGRPRKNAASPQPVAAPKPRGRPARAAAAPKAPPKPAKKGTADAKKAKKAKAASKSRAKKAKQSRKKVAFTAATKDTAPRRSKPRLRRAAAPPVIPNPVPTPELPEGYKSPYGHAPTAPLMYTVTVRLMSGKTFRVVLAPETLLYDLKRQILSFIAPDAMSAGTLLRLPMLVMAGRALFPDTATLRTLGFSVYSTVYCFPEPN